MEEIANTKGWKWWRHRRGRKE